jgi:hypothetical protein
MIFDDLADSIHIDVCDFVVDYATRTMELTILPTVTDNPKIFGKHFRIIFSDIIYIEALFVSGFEGQIEFISWGKQPFDCCAHGTCKLFEKVVKQLDPELLELNLQVINANNYTHYFFENTFGQTIDLLAKSVTVTELAKP